MNDTKYLPYALQSISKEDREAVDQALTSPIITRGPKVELFEDAIAGYCNATYAVAFNSASTALMAAYYAADTQPSDRIITTPNSFIASIGSGMQRGATPIFLDIDRTTGNFSLSQLAHNINEPKLRGKTIVVPVHFSGIPVDMQAIDKMITDPRTIIIEDAAHAIGSRYKDGQMVGSCAWSHMTIFSFHPAKTITTGEGGMVTTNDPELYHRLQLFRNNGIERNPHYLQQPSTPWYYEVVECTSNYNFTEMQAALGLSQLNRINGFITQRQKLLQLYQEVLSGSDYLKFFSPEENVYVCPHLCVVQIDFEAFNITRSEVMEQLKQCNIGTQVHYIPLYRHPVFSNRLGDLSEYFPEMETYYSQALSIPLYPDLTEDDAHRVASELKRILTSKRLKAQQKAKI